MDGCGKEGEVWQIKTCFCGGGLFVTRENSLEEERKEGEGEAEGKMILVCVQVECIAPSSVSGKIQLERNLPKRTGATYFF